MRNLSNFLSATLLATVIVAPQAGADWNVDGPANTYDAQNIVIVVSENPRSNPERTCLAVTLGKALAYNGAREHNVTIFATLDGTALGRKSVVKSRRFKCVQSDGSEISLKKNLEQFLAGNDNNMVLCPICYKERYGDKEPDYGVLPGLDVSGFAVIDVLSNADKIIDF